MIKFQVNKWALTSITTAINIKYPIIQAPCAGHTSAKLVAAVSNEGGLGSLGAGMMPPSQLRETIRAIRQLTSKPFAVNLFCRNLYPSLTYNELQRHNDNMDNILNEIRSELNIPIPTEYQLRSPPFEEQINVLIEERVPVVSFTFGFLPDPILQRFRSVNTFLIGTATTLEEAFLLAGLNDSGLTQRKADAIIVQGLEAGGHRGSFLNDGKQLPVADLVKAIITQSSQLTKRFPIPILAAGGISSGANVYTALHDWNSDGVVIGTLFMMATESMTSKAHKECLLETEKTTKISNAITGKNARGYPNELMKRLEQAKDIPSYNIQSSKTSDILAYATQHGIKDYMLLLSGANAPKAAKYSENGTLTAAEIMHKLVLDVNKMYVNNE
ncbi:2-nitropropane dioxygenase [Cokeromyces recurvatus]|uniref:2-nitropropane dioxygenase n=1 Tax=Cokeromyces recurvatus TaxID=90255 RepID=UPI00221FCC5E|nr:2-nitropropane dioxygenase [Cokeromyces recurvatus]KAI7897670.1 2-nitropropane dioxygenase [Cokeromyces recurvatus]